MKNNQQKLIKKNENKKQNTKINSKVGGGGIDNEI